MAVIYRARRRMRIPSGWVDAGTDITAQALTWRHLDAWIASGRVVLTETTVVENAKNKQRIPVGSEIDWHLRPHKRAHDPSSLDPWRKEE